MSSFSPASTQPDTLPAPRILITNLINSLTTAPLSPPGDTAGNNAGDDAPNPLKALPQSHRPLLVTLHVLYPSLVLPALDLLDRNLVTRVVPETTPPSAGLGRGHGHREGNNPTNPAPAARQHQPPSINATDNASEALVADGQGSPPPRLQPAIHQTPAAAFHLVRSVASTMTRRHHAVPTSASASTTYLVHLDAWNCSCANFAYEAFPAVVGGSSGGEGRNVGSDLVIMGADEAEDEGDDGGETSDWQFGGLSVDGMDDGGVPCCKHLLACLLSEQWGDTLGKYVTERRVSSEEMAGLVADV
ncbi:uncharacterized protein BDZ83DRAFT_749440 [Colletotrichum acutatum]|uniref:Ubiquitin carboxyl-terminal hydrolase family protein n=1 Tax=Glomerella acutata TaxID=27357 RepID=A0AAD8UW68_GLOAC|nr:uncharacterized protein BDZ83DRAFT_749440 [Colletotrichum acutatum]KAK1728154.1 hypothetical protein BDZ83DRAFT_749440 [Colletotrichum acutatum]